MADDRDYRVRWNLRFSDMGIANGLTNHANGLMKKKPDSKKLSNAELAHLAICQ